MIYLDYNATTPVAPEVVSAMMPFLTDHFYNPSSSYPEAQYVAARVSEAREALATLLGCQASQVIWTSGGTESNNWALWGSLRYWQGTRRRILISAIEHPSVTESALMLQAEGIEVGFIPVDSHGIINLSALETLLDEGTALVSVMLANNEIGTIQPVAEIARRAHQVGAIVHTDASQAIGKIPVSMPSLNVDLLTVAGHKIYAPKGIGALLIREGLDFPPWFYGGGQERGKRSGTENVGGVVGLGVAAQLAQKWLADKGPLRQKSLRDQLENEIAREIPQGKIFGKSVPRLPNTLAFATASWTGSALLSLCPQLRAGTGSACHSVTDNGSPTLRAMGVEPELARGLVRLSLGRESTVDDMVTTSQILKQALNSPQINL